MRPFPEIRWFAIAQILLCCFGLHRQVQGQFTTVINVPPDEAPSSIGSDTQLNVHDDGVVASTSLAPFAAGASDGSSVNVEVNILGGSVGSSFDAYAGSVVSISDGSLGKGFDARAGSVINISGGSVGAWVDAYSESVVNLSGGSVGRFFEAHSGSEVTIAGGEFRLDGDLVDGLGDNGDRLPLNLSYGALLSGTLADGTPFAFSAGLIDTFDDGVLELLSSALPPVGPAVISLPGDQLESLGIRGGQTLVVGTNGTVGDYFNAGHGSVVEVVGGEIGHSFEAVGAQISIADGAIGEEFAAYGGSVVNISGGDIAGFSADAGGIVNISGGNVPILYVYNDVVVNISAGGGLSTFGVFGSSVLNLFGTRFELDGVDITSSLTPSTPFEIDTNRGVLSSVLLDGSEFTLDLARTIAARATLYINLMSNPMGDFDLDFDVDGADFLSWQRGESPLPLSQEDLSLWEDGFGMTPGSASNGAVPEPATVTLIGFGMTAMLYWRCLKLSPNQTWRLGRRTGCAATAARWPPLRRESNS